MPTANRGSSSGVAPETHKSPTSMAISPVLHECAAADVEEVFRHLHATKDGLSSAEAEKRLGEYGPNVVARDERHARLKLLRKALLNPLVILLLVLATFSILTDDYRAAIVMLLMVVLGVVLRFVQEARADSAAAKLRAMISVKATVLRDGQRCEIPIGSLVPGDVIELAAGDMIPADVRLISCKDLFVTQASLTGESFPVEKFAAREDAARQAPLELKNVCYLGTSVESGTATAVVAATGLTTFLGGMSSSLVSAGADQLRPGREPVHLADDPLHHGDGAAGLSHQRFEQRRLERGLLLLDGGGGRADARDAADDRRRLPLEGRDGHVAQTRHR